LAHDDQTTEFQIRAIDIDELDIPEMDDDMVLEVEAPVLHEWMDKFWMTKADVQFQITPLEFQCSSTDVERIIFDRYAIAACNLFLLLFFVFGV
jgi:hypothetical protein